MPGNLGGDWRNVGDYYQALIASTGQAQVDKEQVKKAARQNMKWHEQLISHFAGDLPVAARVD